MAIGKDDADQQQGTGDPACHHIFQSGSQGVFVLANADQGIAGDGEDLQKNEGVEDITGEDQAVGTHQQ